MMAGSVCVAMSVNAQGVVFPYGAPGYRYNIYGTASEISPGVETVDFDDSGFPVGQAAFASPTICEIQPTTLWPPETYLAARKRFNLTEPIGGASIHFGIDNDVKIYINGVMVALVLHGGCPYYDEFNFPIPDSMFVVGENVLVAVCHDNGGPTAFDISLTYLMPTAVRRESWGMLKEIYR